VLPCSFVLREKVEVESAFSDERTCTKGAPKGTVKHKQPQHPVHAAMADNLTDAKRVLLGDSAADVGQSNCSHGPLLMGQAKNFFPYSTNLPLRHEPVEDFCSAGQ